MNKIFTVIAGIALFAWLLVKYLAKGMWVVVAFVFGFLFSMFCSFDTQSASTKPHDVPLDLINGDSRRS